MRLRMKKRKRGAVVHGSVRAVKALIGRKPAAQEPWWMRPREPKSGTRKP
jgi:hypothetical protein